MPYVRNPHLNPTENDVLYHFGLSKQQDDFPALFGDIKFVCTGGSAPRMRYLAKVLQKELGIDGAEPENICRADRYSMFKVGPVLCVNHGIGIPSMMIMLNECYKLLHYARCSNVTMIRVGTSGGIGLEPGTVVVSDKAYNGLIEECFEQFIMGNKVRIPAVLDKQLIADLMKGGHSVDFPVVSGGTMGTDDFYEGQARLDGAFCDYAAADKFAFLERLHARGVRNIEMEAPAFAALGHRAGLRCAVVCVAIVNRLEGDQIVQSAEELHEIEARPVHFVAKFIKQQLALH